MRWGKKAETETEAVEAAEEEAAPDSISSNPDEVQAAELKDQEQFGELPAEEAEAPVNQESVRQMREIDQEQAIAAAKGWARLGKFFLEITRPLDDATKLVVGKAQSEAMMEIGRLELEKKAFNADIKGKIDTLQAAAIEAAKKILHGEEVENGHYPAFFDPATRERVYYDIAKDEEIKRIEARAEDLQMRMDDPPVPSAETPPASGENQWREDNGNVGGGAATTAEEEARAS